MISYALVFLLMGCTILTFSILIHGVFPEWHSAIIAGVALFVVIDRLYTYRQLKSMTFLSTEWLIAFGAQWIVILLVVRLLLSYANGIESLRNDLSLFASGDLEKLFTPEYAASLLLAFLVWTLSRQFLDLIDEIGLDQTTALGEENVMPDNPVPAHQRMVNLIFTLGVVLVILTAMTSHEFAYSCLHSWTDPQCGVQPFFRCGGRRPALFCLRPGAAEFEQVDVAYKPIGTGSVFRFPPGI